MVDQILIYINLVYTIHIVIMLEVRKDKNGGWKIESNRSVFIFLLTGLHISAAAEF